MDIDNLDDLDIELPPEFDGLPTFIVGGAVRDTIRGVGSNDIDLMVAEVTPDEMRERGFTEIDNENNDTFAVFLDSLDREVAIAREEVSTGEGHDDFDITPVPSGVEASEAVNRDLKRRDFSVNAMALDARWNTLIDPHGGKRDLESGIIRTVDSNAFEQDPLRILRGARFAARLDADISEATQLLMEAAVDGLDALPTERDRMELEKVLIQADEPSRFFRVLDDIGALEIAFPELHDLKNVPAGPPDFHKEGDTFDHTMLVLDEMKEIRPDDELALLMALGHDLGKAVTPVESLPSHPEHGKAGVEVIEWMAERLGMSNEQRAAMSAASRLHMRFHDFDELRESTIIEMAEVHDTEMLLRLVDLAVADGRGRQPPSEIDAMSLVSRLLRAISVIQHWTGQRLIDEGYSPEEMGGQNFGDLLHQKRVELMRELENTDG